MRHVPTQIVAPAPQDGLVDYGHPLDLPGNCHRQAGDPRLSRHQQPEPHQPGKHLQRVGVVDQFAQRCARLDVLQHPFLFHGPGHARHAFGRVDLRRSLQQQFRRGQIGQGLHRHRVDVGVEVRVRVHLPLIEIEAAARVRQQVGERGDAAPVAEFQVPNTAVLHPGLKFAVAVDPQYTCTATLGEHVQQLQEVKGFEAGCGTGHRKGAAGWGSEVKSI